MLPGLRILFALVVLSFAILIFGFGAIALLRTAHEDFASQPTWQPGWRSPREVAMLPRTDPPAARQETLALLRVDPPASPEPPNQPAAITADPKKDPEAPKADLPVPADTDAQPPAAQSVPPPADETARSAGKQADDQVPANAARTPPEPAPVEANPALPAAAPPGARVGDAATASSTLATDVTPTPDS